MPRNAGRGAFSNAMDRGFQTLVMNEPLRLDLVANPVESAVSYLSTGLNIASMFVPALAPARLAIGVAAAGFSAHNAYNTVVDQISEAQAYVDRTWEI